MKSATGTVRLYSGRSEMMDLNGTVPQFRSEYTVKVPNAAKNGEVVEFFVETLRVRFCMIACHCHEIFCSIISYWHRWAS